MKSKIGVILFVFLGACATQDYYTAEGDHCHTTQVSTWYFNKSCKKGERTGNVNLNVNKPQHDPSVLQKKGTLSELLQAWKGHPSADFIAMAGTPRVINEKGGGHVYLWEIGELGSGSRCLMGIEDNANGIIIGGDYGLNVADGSSVPDRPVCEKLWETRQNNLRR